MPQPAGDMSAEALLKYDTACVPDAATATNITERFATSRLIVFEVCAYVTAVLGIYMQDGAQCCDLDCRDVNSGAEPSKYGVLIRGRG